MGVVFAADTRQLVGSKSLAIIGLSAFLIFLILVVSSHLNKKSEEYKKLLFTLLVIVIFIGTSLLSAFNLYLYSKSEVKGIVNWQAGIEFWVCGSELEIYSPNKFFDKRVGNASIYENDDKRIHINGVILDKNTDASLGTFMRAIGGGITDKSLNLPIDKNILENSIDGDVVDVGGVSNVSKFIKDINGRVSLLVKNGMTCGDNTKAELQVFAYTAGDKLYSQVKLTDPSNFVIKDARDTPPGNCLIVEFGKPKDRTDKLCKEYGQRDASRCHEFGVALYKSKNCYLNQVQLQGSAL